MGEGSWKALCIQDVEREENKSSGHMEICCVAGNSLYDFHGQELCLLHCQTLFEIGRGWKKGMWGLCSIWNYVFDIPSLKQNGVENVSETFLLTWKTKA